MVCAPNGDTVWIKKTKLYYTSITFYTLRPLIHNLACSALLRGIYIILDNYDCDIFYNFISTGEPQADTYLMVANGRAVL